MVLREVRTTAADDVATPRRTTATLGEGAFEVVAVATFGAAFLAAVVAVDLCAVLFFFFLVVVVGVPSRRTPDSNSAVERFERRRIIK